jgi:hypothetical protein
VAKKDPPASKIITLIKEELTEKIPKGDNF